MELIKSILKEFGLDQVKPVASDTSKTSVDDNGVAVASDVQKNIDREAKFDEIDTVTFGLETEDGEIVKVYINAEYADDFEKELGARLGEEDSIEQVLNDVAKTFANRVGEDESVIVDVEWPGEEDEDDEMLGAESLNQEVEHAGDDDGDDQIKTTEETSMATYGEQFAQRVLEAAESNGNQINISQTAVGGDISYLLAALGVEVNADTFLPGVKMKITKTVRSLDGSQKQAIRNFRRVVERLDGGESDVQESFEGELVENEAKEELIDSKLRVQTEKNIFNAVRFLILGADQTQFVSDMVRPQAIADIVAAIKASKFKAGQYRNALKMFLSKVNGGNALVAEASFNRDEKDTESNFKENDSFTKIAASDAGLKMVLEVLAYFGFSERILNHSDIKRELTVDVKRKMRKIIVSSDGRRLKMLFGWGDKAGLIKMAQIAKSEEGSDKDPIQEERWSDMSPVGEVDADVEIADKEAGAGADTKKDSAPQEATWDIKSTADTTSLDNGLFKIVMDAEQAEKLVTDLGDGKKAIVIKDKEGAKFIFAATNDNQYVVSEKGKHQKVLLSSEDIDKITK